MTSSSADRRSSILANRAGIPRAHPQGNPDYLYKAAVCNRFPSVVPCWVGDGGGGLTVGSETSDEASLQGTS